MNYRGMIKDIGVRMKEQRAERKAKLRQHEQRTSNEVRTQFVPFGARTANAGKEERAKMWIKD